MTEKPDGGRSRRRRAARAAGSFGFLALLGICACRQIFGLDEAVSYTPDTPAMDGGAGAAGSPATDSVTQLAAEQPAAEQPAAEQPAAEQPQTLLDMADAGSDAQRGRQ